MVVLRYHKQYFTHFISILLLDFNMIILLHGTSSNANTALFLGSDTFNHVEQFEGLVQNCFNLLYKIGSCNSFGANLAQVY